MYDTTANQVSAFDAKTHLSHLLTRVQQGSCITITKHNMPVAILVPVSHLEQGSVRDMKGIIESIRLARKGITLGAGNSIQKFKEEGRR
ncbi:MAG: type II toxin-antitoxin system prevent-host-death family antitoxin [Alphaproteobacteria bacterium]